MFFESTSLATARIVPLLPTLLSVSSLVWLSHSFAEQSSSLADMLEAIGAGSSRQVGKTDWADLWLESPEFEQVKRQIAELDEEGLRMEESLDPSLRKACTSASLHRLTSSII